MKLLIVDDSLIMRRAIERSLGQSRFTEVHTATNGLLAVEMFERHQPDVVTMDITMPDMDGLAAVDEIMKRNPRAVILVVSALADKATAVEAVKRGAQGFLLKPVTAQSVQAALDDILSD
ncbi:MAG: response regulator [Verrucomicrobia bacterium]|jgi:two-component system chemotaxis response regulator CheY|nr:response regulator [Verrucomicrobiota bacterium]